MGLQEFQTALALTPSAKSRYRLLTKHSRQKTLSVSQFELQRFFCPMNLLHKLINCISSLLTFDRLLKVNFSIYYTWTMFACRGTMLRFYSRSVQVQLCTV